jgi:hypothetical protein
VFSLKVVLREIKDSIEMYEKGVLDALQVLIVES